MCIVFQCWCSAHKLSVGLLDGIDSVLEDSGGLSPAMDVLCKLAGCIAWEMADMTTSKKPLGCYYNLWA
jgi:hypothetical protein